MSDDSAIADVVSRMAGSTGRHIRISRTTRLELSPGRFSITAAQYPIVVLGVRVAAHNLFVVRNDALDVIAELNGFAFNDRVDVINTTGLSGKLYCYLTVSPDRPGAPLKPTDWALYHPVWPAEVVAQDQADRIQQRLQAMLAVSAAINDRRWTYRAWSANSNAAHAAMAREAGIALPRFITHGGRMDGSPGSTLLGPVGARRRLAV